MTLQLTTRLAKTVTKKSPTKHDSSVLIGPDGLDARLEFDAEVLRQMEALSAEGQFSALGECDKLMAAITKACDTLPKTPKPSPSWFAAHAGVLRPAINKRNEAVKHFMADPTSAETRLSAVVAGLKRSYNIQAGYGPFWFIIMGQRPVADINAPKKLLPFVTSWPR